MSAGFTRMILIAPLLAAALGGCVVGREVEKTTPSPVVMAPATPVPAPPVVSTDRVVHPDGRWQLYGDGRGIPYYWVWIPNGSTVTASPTPPSRPEVAVVPQADRAYTFPEGRWQLYGDGRTSPYFWVWIPRGSAPPLPPLPPQTG